MEKTQEMNMTNKVNIEFLTSQLNKALADIEELKDKVIETNQDNLTLDSQSENKDEKNENSENQTDKDNKKQEYLETIFSTGLVLSIRGGGGGG